MAGWQGLHTFVTSDVVTAADLNAYIRDNTDYLLNLRGFASGVYTSGSNINVTGAGFASFANIDGTNFKLTFTVQSTRAVLVANVPFYKSSGVSDANLDWYNGTVRAGDTTQGLVRVPSPASINQTPFPVIGVFTGLTPNTAYTFTLQMKLLTTTDNYRIVANQVSTFFGLEF